MQKDKIDIHDILHIEDRICTAEAMLRDVLRASQRTGKTECVCVGSYSDCIGTLRVNISSLKRAIEAIEKELA